MAHSTRFVYAAFPVALVAFGASAYAWMIGNLPKDKLDPRSCKITMSQPDEKRPGGKVVTPQVACSGTIIGKSQILSAAHCFVGKEFTEGVIECPGDAPKKVSNWTIPKDYREAKSQREAAELGRLDLAVVRIDDSFKTTPAKLPASPVQMFELFEKTKAGEPADCGLYGYGENEKYEAGDHNGRSVLFEEWKLGTRTLKKVDPLTKKVLEVKTEPILGWWQDSTLAMTFRAQDFDFEQKLTNAVRQGDSGGGLICPDDKGNPILMGVTGGHSVGTDAGGFEAHVAIVTSTAHRLDLIGELLAFDEAIAKTSQPTKPQASVSSRVHRPTPRSH